MHSSYTILGFGNNLVGGFLQYPLSDWADFAKLLAIVAVMTDYTNGVLYSNYKIAYFSLYSVSLFVLLMGITNFNSLLRDESNKRLSWLKRNIKNIGSIYDSDIYLWLSFG